MTFIIRTRSCCTLSLSEFVFSLFHYVGYVHCTFEGDECYPSVDNVLRCVTQDIVVIEWQRCIVLGIAIDRVCVMRTTH